LSLLTAVIVLEKFGITINTITLADSSSLWAKWWTIRLSTWKIFSAIAREQGAGRIRARSNAAAWDGGRDSASSGSVVTGRRVQSRPQRSIFQVVLGASLEVRRAVVYATFIVALIFLPVLTLTGLQGSFFAPLALSYILAIMASLLVALTVTPALAYLFFDRGCAPRASRGCSTRSSPPMAGRSLSWLAGRARLF